MVGPTHPDPWSMFREEDIATLVPRTTSEVRQLLRSDWDETVPYVRPVVEPPPPTRRSPVASTPDMALCELVAFYERRTDDLERGRAHTHAIIMQAQGPADDRARAESEPRDEDVSMRALLQEHAYKIIFSLICVWGTLHLVFVR